MNKSDLAKQIAELHGHPENHTLDAINVMFQAMTDELANDGRIEIRGFGSFTVRKYKSYLGRNPKSGQQILVKPKKLPYFKIGKWLAIQLSPNLLTDHPTFKNHDTSYGPMTDEQIQFKIDNPNIKKLPK